VPNQSPPLTLHSEGIEPQAAILLVDDEPNVVRFLARALLSHGYVVDRAGDGAHGLALARTGHYQLIVLDLALPDVSGLTTLRAIKAAVPDQPVLVLSGLSDVESKVRSLELGASDYMTKPFALAELIARVRARLRESAAPPTERFMRIGDVTLDQERHTAAFDGRQVSLSPRELGLLAHLMRRAGTVCSRDQLLADVWDYQFDPGTNVVDVYVRRLRKKLGDHVIETVRSVGYTLHVA
jgi:two-component system OmpR family response regulator